MIVICKNGNKMGINDDMNNVDMLAEAREAQWSALTFMGEDAVKALAPAKVNLFLGVGDKTASGYHEVVTVMHALALHDVLYFSCLEPEMNEHEAQNEAIDLSSDDETIAYAGENDCIRVHVEVVDKTHISGAGFASCPTDEVSNVAAKDNLVFKAIAVLAQELEIATKQEIHVRIEKHIPSQAGLGGGSSDAAATLVAMSGIWGNSESGPSIHKVAASLGADVSFFLEGGCGFFTGIGEAFERALVPMKQPVVIVRPNTGVSTAAAYSAFDENPILVPAELLARVDDASAAEQVPLFNNLQPVACKLLPEIEKIIDWLGEQEGVTLSGSETPGELTPDVLMSGSGSASFAITETYADAARIATDASARGWWARATTFSSLKACTI